MSTEAMIKFDASQERFFRDEARVAIACWHRQKGKDFVAAAKAVDNSLRTGQPWFLISMTQRQADATFAKCRQFFDFFKAVLKIQGAATIGDGLEYVEYDKWIDHHFVAKSRELILPGGGKVTALPGRDPDTLAGLTGNILLTELGLFPGGGYEHWRTVFPLTTRGYKCLGISTPRGRNTKFCEVVNDPEHYSVHFCDIHQSVEKEGFVLKDQNGQPTTIEAFRRLYNDPAGWAREYLCQFSGDLEALVTWAQLTAAVDPVQQFQFLRVEGDAGWKPGAFRVNRRGGGRLEMGWDVARSGDLASLWVNHAPGNGPKRLAGLAIMHNCSFALQQAIVREAMESQPGSVGCGDATGLGQSDNETLATKYRDRWQSVTFGEKTKSDMANGMRAAFRDHQQLIPLVDGPHKMIATDIYAMQVEETGGQDSEKKLKITETENPLEDKSHCDIGWSCGLAIQAGRIERRSQLPPPMARKPAGC